MPPKQRTTTEILMRCRRCKWKGQVFKCKQDESGLRCPKCMAVVKQVTEKVVKMPKNKKTLKQILGNRGAQKARRILQSEYQKYLISCLKSGNRNAMQFEEWVKSLT